MDTNKSGSKSRDAGSEESSDRTERGRSSKTGSGSEETSGDGESVKAEWQHGVDVGLHQFKDVLAGTANQIQELIEGQQKEIRKYTKIRNRFKR